MEALSWRDSLSRPRRQLGRHALQPFEQRLMRVSRSGPQWSSINFTDVPAILAVAKR